MLQRLAGIPAGVEYVTVAVYWIVDQREIPSNYTELMFFVSQVYKRCRKNMFFCATEAQLLLR